MQGNREWDWEGMGMSILENNGNGNKCLAGMEMGMVLILRGMERNGKAESHSRAPLATDQLPTCDGFYCVI